MRTISGICLALAALMGIPTMAQASLQVGDEIHIHDGAGYRGGLFNLYKGGHTGSDEFLMGTFCVEVTEYFRPGTTSYYVGGLNEETTKTGGPKPLTEKVAWVYTQFLDGGLPGSYVGTAAQNNALQKFIWDGMDWSYSSASLLPHGWDTGYYTLLANAWTAADPGWTGFGGVKIIDLRADSATGAWRQDQLYRPPQVPEPLSIVIWSLLGLGLAGRHVLRARRP